MDRSPLLVGLTLLAVLSPLLTSAALFQQKEWRLDRLRAHLLQEGWFNQLFGRVRPLVVLFFFVAFRIIDLLYLDRYLVHLTFGTLGILASLSAAQMFTGKQRKPVWTAKALLVAGLSILLVSITVLSGILTILSPLLVLASPFIIFIAWVLLLPLDTYLKRRTFARARAVRERLRNPIIIGIAGSVGKTTVKELLGTVLADLKPFVTPEHVNTEMGVSQWLLNLAPRLAMHTSPVLIVEMGAYGKGEIDLLASIIRPTMGVVTAIGSDHLALFKTEQAIIEANGELIRALPPHGHSFLYGDNPGCRSLMSVSPCPVTTVGTGPDATLRATDIVETTTGLQIFPHQPLPITRFSVPLHGRHNIGNILLAIAVARALNISDARIRELLATHRPLSRTFNVRMEQGVLLVDDTYNISPLSLKAALAWAESRAERPRVLLTSGLMETGAEERRFLEEIGSFARGKVERVIFTADRGRTAFQQGFGLPVELLTEKTVRVESEAVLLCIGRMPRSAIQRLLPPAQSDAYYPS